MKVLKFGGTSVGSVKGLANVKRIVEAIDEEVIVVVSALGGLTDRLLLASKLASEGNEAYLAEYAEIVRRHDEVIDGIVPEVSRESVKRHVRDDRQLRRATLLLHYLPYHRRRSALRLVRVHQNGRPFR